jgi:hypothetical protein
MAINPAADDPMPPIIQAFDEMRQAEATFEAARLDLLAKREWFLLTFELTYASVDEMQTPGHPLSGKETSS